MSCFQSEVASRAEADDLASRDYACTILVAIVGADCAAFMQVGDGAIVVSRRTEPDQYAWVFWPQEGEYANMTQFATEPGADELLEYELVEGSVDELALFTDGLQRLALHYQSLTAHAPFFRPVFAAVRLAPEGHAEGLSAALADYLRSRPVEQRTDDDKTLILATRRADGERPYTSEYTDGVEEQA